MSDATPPPLVLARHEPVADPAAARILALPTVLLVNLLALVPVGGVLVGCAVGWTGLVLAGGPAGNFPGRAFLQQFPPSLGLGLPLLVVGAGLAVGAIILALRGPGYYGSLYLRWRTVTAIRRRRHYLVNPDHQQAEFVEVVPRAHWQQLMLETASDVGFILLDRAGARVLFEGTREQYEIPLAALTAAEVALVRSGDLQQAMVILRFHTSAGKEELCFDRRGRTGVVNEKDRLAWSTAFVEGLVTQRPELQPPGPATAGRGAAGSRA